MKLIRDEDIREEFTFGEGSILSEWKRSILRELVDPASDMDKQELSVAHQVISRFLEVVQSVHTIESE